MGASDLILLDIMLPKMDGFDVCKRVREKSNVPIIMITAREEEVDKVLGLELGADDYITKPFSVRELLARVKANMRRFAGGTKEEASSDIIVAAPELVIDTTKYEAIKNGVTLDLTLREYELLKFLVIQPNRIFSREALLSSVWGYEFYGELDRTDDLSQRFVKKQYVRIKKRADSLRAAGIKEDEAEYCEAACNGIERFLERE